MNSSITQCPECSTRFKVSAEQLSAHNGMVRCGRCSAVFNAAEQLQNDEPSPQLSLPIAAPEDKETDAGQLAAPAPAGASSSNEAEAVAQESLLQEDGTAIVQPPLPHESISPPVESSPGQSETSLQQMSLQADEVSAEGNIAPPAPKPRRWPWLIGALLALLVLFAQILYFHRVELAAQLPGLKPALTAYCGLLHCTIPLPKKAELMSIESSDLEADPLQSNLITLSALLHNRAPHIQAYPNLELSLTDVQDKVVARRTFIPPEYLKMGEDEKLGLAANREISVRLHLDTTDLKPTGYKLFLFYPQ